MKFDEKSLEALKLFLKDNTKKEAINKISSIYWPTMLKNIHEAVLNKEDIEQFCKTEYDFINMGIIHSILDNAKEIRYQLNKNAFRYSYLKVLVVTEWISKVSNTIRATEKIELMTHDVKNLTVKLHQAEKKIQTIQQTRKELLLKEFSHTTDPVLQTQINELVSIDNHQIHYLQTKNQMADGTFFSVEDRRSLANQTKNIEKEISKRETLYSRIQSPERRTRLRKYNTSIDEYVSIKLAIEKDIDKKRKELTDIKTDQLLLSITEFENRLHAECTHLRDLMKLSANRLHTESCSIFRPGNTYFTKNKIYSCIERILEFDPKVFNNRKVEIHGKPNVLLVPGNGNGLYDWKNNTLVIPLFPPCGNFMASVATAIIEYRLDVDEDKYILTSYQKLPEHKQVKSHIILRSSLTRDYIKWMNSEYQGFKVLSKESRKWFEHEIAPDKNDIFCPPQYRPFEISSKKFRNLLETLENRVSKKESKASKDDLFLASILNFQQRKFVESYEYTNRLLQENIDFVFAYYNLGIICMKIHYKQKAIQAFHDFIDHKSQSWWTSNAKNHLQRLEKY